MLLLPKNRRSFFLRRLLDKRNSFIRSENFPTKHALHFHNIAQFLGVINDNVFKLLTVFLLIDLKGVESSSSVLFWVGTVYVLPFLFFSSAAGVFADKFSKQKMIVLLKSVEVLTTSLAIFAFWLKSEWASYFLLFLLSLHSAAFGPPKYSIIPEIVEPAKISKANGLITSFTYLGMIVGTFLASFTTQVTNRNFALCAGVTLVIAILGLISSLFIPHTKPSRTTSRVKFFFLADVYKMLKFCYHRPFLLVSVLAASFFLFLGAFFQLNIIPFAIQSLGLSEFGGGYLFLSVAIGIAIGAILVGKLSKHHIELGFACIAGPALFILVIGLALLPKFVILDVFLLILIGMFSGFFIVPFDAYIQKHSPDEKRGQVIATTNFMSFCGVLLAPFSIYFLSGTCKLSSAQGFFVISLVVLIVALAIILNLFQIFLHFVGKKLLPIFYKISHKHSAICWNSKPFLLVADPSPKLLPIIASCHENISFFLIKTSFSMKDLFLFPISSLKIIYLDAIERSLTEEIRKKLTEDHIPCLLAGEDIDLNALDLPHKQSFFFLIETSREKNANKISISFNPLQKR